MRIALRLGIAAVLSAPLGCGPVVTYAEAPAVPPRAITAHVDILESGDEEALRPSAYAVVGTFREASYDAMPGGPLGFRALMRALGEAEGCDAVAIDGAVKAWDGSYAWTRGRSAFDGRRGWRLVPAVEQRGRTAECLVETESSSPAPAAVPAPPVAPGGPAFNPRAEWDERAVEAFRTAVTAAQRMGTDAKGFDAAPSSDLP